MSQHFQEIHQIQKSFPSHFGPRSSCTSDYAGNRIYFPGRENFLQLAFIDIWLLLSFNLLFNRWDRMLHRDGRLFLHERIKYPLKSKMISRVREECRRLGTSINILKRGMHKTIQQFVRWNAFWFCVERNENNTYNDHPIIAEKKTTQTCNCLTTTWKMNSIFRTLTTSIISLYIVRIQVDAMHIAHAHTNNQYRRRELCEMFINKIRYENSKVHPLTCRTERTKWSSMKANKKNKL